jgi:flagellar biosynthesis protein FlhF
VQCKNYRAFTMAEAMAAVKADLGADAVVLHTRSMLQGGFLGIGRKTVIEVTAARAERETSNGRSKRDPATTSIAGGAANRAYGSIGRASGSSEAALDEQPSRLERSMAARQSPSPPSGGRDLGGSATTQFDRDRTRLLAQAMAVKLEREQAESPRTSAPTSASANAAATSTAATRSGSAGPSSSSSPTSSGGVAQRFVLIPANDAAKAAERRAVAQPIRPTVAGPQPQSSELSRAPQSAPERIAPPTGPIANMPLSISPDVARASAGSGSGAAGAPGGAAVPSAPSASRGRSTEPTVIVESGHRLAFGVTPIMDARFGEASPAAAASPVPTVGPASIGIELASIDRLVDEVLGRSAPGAITGTMVPTRPEKLETLYANLLSQELGDELAAAIVMDLQATLSAEELASDHAVRSAAIERVASLLPSAHSQAWGEGLRPSEQGGWRRDGRPLTVAFVGPTGVGKTTTVAKIAASLKLRYGARVGLITCDTYRIAAVDQLRTYADIIGLPLEIVLAPAQMQQARQRLAELDVILIDTAGRSQNDTGRLGELAAMVQAADPHETHLVLSSTAHEKVLMREAQAFSRVGVDRVVLTKLDEAVGLGAVLRVLRQVGRQVSYLTTGQEVPQHIEAARPGRLAELVLGGAWQG